MARAYWCASAASQETSRISLIRLESEPPPLARIDQIEARAFDGVLPSQFRIAESLAGDAHTEVAPDAAICAACAEEIVDPFERRFRYPFTNCTHCGPRLSIVKGIPYDRANTTMAPFEMCEECGANIDNPADRRFHAEAIALPCLRTQSEARPLRREAIEFRSSIRCSTMSTPSAG